MRRFLRRLRRAFSKWYGSAAPGSAGPANAARAQADHAVHSSNQWTGY